MARLAIAAIALLLVTSGCASDGPDAANADGPSETSPPTTRDLSDPYERIAGGVLLQDSAGFVQICFRLVEQPGDDGVDEVLCADARASYAADDYVVFDPSRVGTERLDDLTITTEQSWLYGAELEDGLHLQLRPAREGEVIP